MIYLSFIVPTEKKDSQHTIPQPFRRGGIVSFFGGGGNPPQKDRLPGSDPDSDPSRIRTQTPTRMHGAFSAIAEPVLTHLCPISPIPLSVSPAFSFPLPILLLIEPPTLCLTKLGRRAINLTWVIWTCRKDNSTLKIRELRDSTNSPEIQNRLKT